MKVFLAKSTFSLQMGQVGVALKVVTNHSLIQSTQKSCLHFFSLIKGFVSKHIGHSSTKLNGCLIGQQQLKKYRIMLIYDNKTFN